MFRILTIISVLLSVTAGAAPILDRIYLQLPAESFTEVFTTKEYELFQYALAAGDIQKLNFGLQPHQIAEIYKASNGQIDFRNIYVVRSLFLPFQSLNKYVSSYGSSEFQPPVINTQPDPEVHKSWWQKALGVKKAWNIATGKGVTLADCDAGYHTHEDDLQRSLDLTAKEDFSDLDDPFNVEDGGYVYHGTAVAAIMTADLNGVGTNGIANDAKLVPLQNYNYGPQDDTDKEEATAKCILKAIQIPDVDIIVLENQTSGSSETFKGTREAVKLALLSGITIVSAAGNSSNELIEEEIYDTGSIIVGAVDRDGDQAYFSNYGSRVSIAAFGEDVRTLYGPNGNFGDFGGTSAATPQVAATVALMLESNPQLLPEDIKSLLVKTRKTSAYNQNVGGLLDTAEAVQAAANFYSPDLAFRHQQAQSLRKWFSTILTEPSP